MLVKAYEFEVFYFLYCSFVVCFMQFEAI